jgi:hypothetical protein
MRDATPDHPDMQLIARAPELLEALENIRMLVVSQLQDDLRGAYFAQRILEFCTKAGVES